MLHYKQFEGDISEFSTQTIFNYKPYEYSEEDYQNTYQKYLVATLETEAKIQLLNSVFLINGSPVFAIENKSIKDVLEQLEGYGVKVEWYSDVIEKQTYEQVLESLPGILLTDFSNYVSISDDADISPYTLKPIHNRSILTLDSIRSITILDKNGVKLPFIQKEDNVFYEVLDSLKVITTEISTNFRLYIDLAPRRYTDPSTVSYLLNYKEEI